MKKSFEIITKNETKNPDLVRKEYFKVNNILLKNNYLDEKFYLNYMNETVLR